MNGGKIIQNDWLSEEVTYGFLSRYRLVDWKRKKEMGGATKESRKDFILKVTVVGKREKE